MIKEIIVSVLAFLAVAGPSIAKDAVILDDSGMHRVARASFDAKKIMDGADKNGDRLLSRSEYKRVAGRNFSDIDLDKNGTVSFGELMDFEMKKQNAKASNP